MPRSIVSPRLWPTPRCTGARCAPSSRPHATNGGNRPPRDRSIPGLSEPPCTDTSAREAGTPDGCASPPLGGGDLGALPLPALLPHPHADLDRGAGEVEVLPQPPLDEPPITRLDEPGSEQDEPGRTRAGLGGEEDPGLLPAPHRMRVRRREFTQEGVQPAGRDALLP